jgi:hypothetical protein
VALATAGVRRAAGDGDRNSRATLLESMRVAWHAESNVPSWAASAGSLAALLDGARKIKYTEVGALFSKQYQCFL